MTAEDKNQFICYPLSKDIKEALELLGYHIPTAIQQSVIPAILDGRQVVAKAPTGSGKTAAFGIPICEHIVWEENAPQALILEPTRELAVQVQDELFHIGRKKRLKVPAVFGGFPIEKQIQTLKQKSHIVVGTPGRVMDLARRECLVFGKMTHLIIDEADLMLDMGFIDEVKAIINQIPDTCQISLFSATMKPGVQALADTYIREMVYVEQEQSEQQPDIIQKIYKTEQEDKYETFIRVLMEENPDSCIIFCGTREMTTVLFQKLRRQRIFCGMLHGELDQKERLKTIAAFRKSAFRFLIATDVAARGIDLDGITHVINYDFPTGKETYVHRIGRTGRNGKSGTAISFVCEQDQRMLSMIEEYTGQSIPVYENPSPDQHLEQEFFKKQRQKPTQKADKTSNLNKGITRLTIGGGKKSKIRAGDIVGTICSIEGVAVLDIGVIDIRDSLSYVEILNQKGSDVLEALQTKTIKGKIRKVRVTRGRG